MHIRIGRELVITQLAEKEVVAKRPSQPGKSWDFQRHSPIHPRHIDRLSIVAVNHGATFVGPPPQALLSDRDVMSRPCHRSIGVEQPKSVGGSHRHWRLKRIDILLGYDLSNR